MITNSHLEKTLAYAVGASHIPVMKIQTLKDSMDFKMDGIGIRATFMFEPPYCGENILASARFRTQKPFHDFQGCPTNAYFMRGKFTDCGGLAGTFTFNRTIRTVVW